MFTETELREALQHSAARADTSDLDTIGVTPDHDAKRPWLLPLVAAASVAALAAGVIAFVGSAGESSAPAMRDDSAAASLSAPPAASGPLAAVDLVDRAVVGVDAEYQFGTTGDRQVGSQTIRHSLGTGEHDGVMTVDIAPGAAIDANRVTKGKRVDIAGTTGYFSALKLYPLDGSTGPGSDKWLPHWTIAFKTPAGDWAFAWIELGTEGDDSNLTADDVSVGSSAKIVTAYDKLKVQWKDGTARQALRFASLPAGMTLRSATFQQIDGKIDNEYVIFVDGKKSLDVNLSSETDPATPECASPGDGGSTDCVTPLDRRVASGTLTVSGSGYDKYEQVAVLKGTRVVADPAAYVTFEQAVTP